MEFYLVTNEIVLQAPPKMNVIGKYRYKMSNFFTMKRMQHIPIVYFLHNYISNQFF